MPEREDGGGLGRLQDGPFSTLTEKQIESLEAVSRRRHAAQGDVIFQQGDELEHVYVVETGLVHVQRETPFGTQQLSTVREQSLIGEMNFIDGLPASADAVAVEPTDLAVLSHADLKELFDTDRELGVVLFREFWLGLTQKIRDATELMASFFPDEAGGEPPAPPPDEAKESTGEQSQPTVDAKASILGDHGLSGADLRALAEFAQAITYQAGDTIFRDGDEGDSLFVIMNGEVLISKQIPGVGEEALVILRTGDAFGEMAIVDGSLRSASAAAHAAGTTVLRIDQSAIKSLLDENVDSAYPFLLVLCRRLSVRLREVNDKIVSWRMMSGF